MKSLSTRHYVYIGALILLALVLASCAGLDLGDSGAGVAGSPK